MKSYIKNIIALFEEWTDEEIILIKQLPESGSYRKYFRIKSKTKQALGVFNDSYQENLAFIEFSKHFIKKNLNVPHIYATDLENNVYLIEDLGDTTLYSLIVSTQKENTLADRILELYYKAIKYLVKFQIKGHQGLNYKFCYPRKEFDKQSIQWDLNYFKYYFLKTVKISFDEQKLEHDFLCLTDFLIQAPKDYFMYRDFQSRNIMFYNNDLYFIDYQGGRRGALQYDIASLLMDARANIPSETKEQLLKCYIVQLQKYKSIDIKKFLYYYYAFALIRILQAMGTYGFRGLIEHKPHFLLSIPYALKNIEYILNCPLNIKLPALFNALKQLLKSKFLNKFLITLKPRDKLTVRINSFSYKNGIPIDETANGGGYVFDCRGLFNPGKYTLFKDYTGKDRALNFLFKKFQHIKEFLDAIYKLIEASIKEYQRRGFTDLMVSFGCTGGRHRSVYCAEQLAKFLTKKFNLNIIVTHHSLDP